MNFRISKVQLNYRVKLVLVASYAGGRNEVNKTPWIAA